MSDDFDFEQFMANGLRWRELLPEGRYAWPLHDWDHWNTSGVPPLIGYAVYWRRRDATLSTFLIGLGTSLTREAAKALSVADKTDENNDREGRLASIVYSPGKYAGEYGMHTGNCGFCGRKLTDPESVARGLGPECLKKLAVTK